MKDDSGTGLPAGVEAAWGLRDRPGKGPQRRLTLERIIDAAIAIAEADGLGAVSMSRVAKELGAATMALYRYVSAKDELLLLMMDVPAEAPPAAPAPDEPWRVGLARWCRAWLDVLHRHPWLLRVQVSTPPITPNQMAWLENGLQCMRGIGLTPTEQLSTVMLLSGFVRNYATIDDDIRSAARAAGSSQDEAMAAYGQQLRKLIDPVRFPAVSEVISSGAIDDDADEFAFGLDRVLDGIEALVRTRAAATS